MEGKINYNTGKADINTSVNTVGVSGLTMRTSASLD